MPEALFDYFNKNELTVILNALEAHADELPEDDEDQPVLESLIRRFNVWTVAR